MVPPPRASVKRPWREQTKGASVYVEVMQGQGVVALPTPRHSSAPPGSDAAALAYLWPLTRPVGLWLAPEVCGRRPQYGCGRCAFAPQPLGVWPLRLRSATSGVWLLRPAAQPMGCAGCARSGGVAAHAALTFRPARLTSHL